MEHYLLRECPFGDLPCEHCPHGRSPFWFPPCTEVYTVENGVIRVWRDGRWVPTLAVSAQDLVPADQAGPVRARAQARA